MTGKRRRRRAAGGRVLVWADGATEDLLHAALSVGTPQSATEEERLTVVDVDSERALFARLATTGGGPCVVVLDPARIAADPRIATRLGVFASVNGTSVEFLLFGDPTAATIRGVAEVSRLIECRVAVRGVDDERVPALVRDVVSRQRAGGANALVPPLDLSGLPESVRGAWACAASDPASASVKGIAFQAGISRRTLERCHQVAGFPPPARLLGMLCATARRR